MWWVRVLSGQQAGQKFKLNEGSNIIGRAPHCEIKLASNSISKEHLKIEVYGEKIILTDLGSRNGTFVNGLKITNKRLDDSDKVSLHNILIDFINVPESFTEVRSSASSVAAPTHAASQQKAPMIPVSPGPGSAPPYSSGNLALSHDPMHMQAHPPHHQPLGHIGVDPQYHQDFQAEGSSDHVEAPKKLTDFGHIISHYFENVVMPGIYKIPTLMDFKWALGLFIGAFILFVTAFSTVPLMRILRSSIEKESQRRALTIARTQALINQSSVAQGTFSTLTTTMAANEPGVKEAYLINGVDGSIIAPAKRAGAYPEDPYVHQARLLGKEDVSQVDSDTIAAIVPIRVYNPSTGQQSNHAYSVVIYNMGILAVNDERTLSLFIQTFFIALVVGGVLFVFFYKMIDHPIRQINLQLDKALKDSTLQVKTDYKYENLHLLISNINSALSRSESGGAASAAPIFESDRTQEMEALTQMVGFACMAVKAQDLTIASLNTAFEEKSGLSSADLLYGPLDNILDQALKLSVQDLIEKAQQSPHQSHVNTLEMAGVNHDITLQTVMGSQEVSYYLVSIVQSYEGYDE